MSEKSRESGLEDRESIGTTVESRRWLGLSFPRKRESSGLDAVATKTLDSRIRGNNIPKLQDREIS
ncbi:MAG: hypothetical protein ACR2J7_09400 [Luteimonas sp.]